MARPAPAAKAALDEATFRWPGRSRASDGLCGDTAHQLRRSDHNPDGNGLCCAFDLTHDLPHGVDAHALLDQLRRRRDPRVKYLISRRRIAGPPDWEWRPYGGTNPHMKHGHVSLTQAGRYTTGAWWAPAATPGPPAHPAAPTVPTTRLTEYPGGEGMLTRHDIHIDALDDSGNGWVELPVDTLDVVSLVANGPYPPIDGYWNSPILTRQARGEMTVVAITEGPPGAPLDFTIWVVS